MSRVRIDKWLWAARFYKTRALAQDACEMGRIECNEVVAKPAREVHVGDLIRLKFEGVGMVVEVKQLSEVRGPAAVAQGLYEETEQSKLLREKLAEERKAMPHYESFREEKPTKKDRRDINRLRGR